MPYRPLGYRAISPGRQLIPAANYLIHTLTKAGNYDFAIGAALVKAFNPRSFVKATDRDAFLALREDPNFKTDAMYKAVMTILYAMFEKGSFGDHRVAKPEYITDAIMTVDEMINEAIGEYVDKKLPPPEAYPMGEKTTFEQFRGQVLYTIQDLATISKKRISLLDHFQRYFGNILYCMYDGTMPYSSLGAWEKSCLAVYVYNQDMKYRMTRIGATGDSVPLRFPIARDVDPLLEESMARLRSVCTVGNWTNFTRIVSNKDPRELIYLVAPVVDKLNIVSGDKTDRGPYCDLDLQITDTLDWGIDQQMASLMEEVTFDADADVRAQYITTGWRLPFSDLDRMNMPILMDYPNVDLAFQSVKPDQDRLVASWNSTVYQRRVSDLSGATGDSLLLDIATATTGEGKVTMNLDTVESFKWVDLSDPSMTDRRITNLYTKSDLNEIHEDIYFIRDGAISRAKVNMTAFYYNNGDIGFKPALIEYMKVSRAWFEKAAPEKVVAFIIGKLGLSRFDARESTKLVNISHNVAMYQRYTDKAPHFDVLEYLKVLSGRSANATVSNPPYIQ